MESFADRPEWTSTYLVGIVHVLDSPATRGDGRPFPSHLTAFSSFNVIVISGRARPQTVDFPPLKSSPGIPSGVALSPLIRRQLWFLNVIPAFLVDTQRRSFEPLLIGIPRTRTPHPESSLTFTFSSRTCCSASHRAPQSSFDQIFVNETRFRRRRR